MTREESIEALCVAFEKLDEDEQRGMIRLIEQMQRPTPLLPRRR